ncbi:MAG TPA: peptidoglycan DD-metalloendopeptidase family protein, partial [Chloroflexota bacterium]|nr:peptidoglycan DD-metalloendopeptidase family protein [Chloroflexota bacterium]
MRLTVLLVMAAVCVSSLWNQAAAASSANGAESTSLDALVKRYSKQCVFSLNPGESYLVKLKNGTGRSVRLVSVKEQRDSVIGLVRRADVAVEVGGKPLNLVCAPYVMPTVIRGLRIQADTTSEWVDMPKRVQFSAWDASDPIVDTKRFGFPIRDYRLLSHGTQAFNEPVHLGQGDGDPAGQKFYHSYGMDMAGFEGAEEVISATEGDVIFFWPSREDLCSVVVQDADGFTWEYAHLASISPEIVLGAHVKRGAKIGMLGKTGPSGNFSHLHLGSFLSRADMEGGRENKRLNLYPWLVTAYQAAHPKSVYAVARPHHLAMTGEGVLFDGSNSLAFGTKVAAWKWVLPDGRTIRKPTAEAVFDKPGSYVATLWIKGANGAEDVDFCQVRVFSRGKPEDHMPTIFMSYTPTEGVHVGQPVTFRFWLQGENPQQIAVDFGDGSQRI